MNNRVVSQRRGALAWILGTPYISLRSSNMSKASSAISFMEMVQKQTILVVFQAKRSHLTLAWECDCIPGSNYAVRLACA